MDDLSPQMLWNARWALGKNRAGWVWCGAMGWGDAMAALFFFFLLIFPFEIVRSANALWLWCEVFMLHGLMVGIFRLGF